MKALILILGICGFGLFSALSGVFIGRVARRFSSLRSEILVILIACQLVAGVGALILADYMVLESGTVRGVLVVLGLTLPFVVVLVSVALRPLQADVDGIRQLVNQLRVDRSAPNLFIDRSDELGQIASAVEDVKLHRQRIQIERNLVMSSISHDLRSPIASMQAAIEALEDEVAPDPPRYLRSIASDLNTLCGLVNDLFLLSQIESGLIEMETETVELTELVDETFEALAPLANKNDVNLRLVAAEPITVEGNTTGLSRVLRNLLDNSIRHSPPSSIVTVSAELAGDRAVVSVADEGSGISPEFAARAFDRFARADASRNRESGGAGLGLAIAKGLVEAHRGTIGIVRSDGRGTTICFELPVRSVEDGTNPERRNLS